MIPYYQFHTISLGPLTIQVWGLLVSIGILVALFVIRRRARKMNLSEQHIFDLAFWILIGSFVGARVLYAVYNPAYIFSSVWNFFKVWEGGLSVMGGFMGAFVAGFWYTRQHKLDFLRYADVILYGLPLGLAIGRCGCGLIHDHIGKVTTVPWGVRWTDGTVRHENGLYLALNNLLMFLALVWLYRKPRWKGFALVFFFVWYGFVRFWLDFLRATDLPGVSDVRFFGLTPAQYISIGMFLFGIYLFFRLRPKKTQVSPSV